MKRLFLSVAAAAATLCFASGAEAATAVTSLNVSLTAVTACSIATTPVNFGSGTGISDTQANGDITVTCSQNVPYNIALDGGYFYDGGSRNLSNGTTTRRYYLFRDSGLTAEWGDIDFTGNYPFGPSLTDMGNGMAQPHTVYGLTQGGTPLPAGYYYDYVTVTVHY